MSEKVFYIKQEIIDFFKSVELDVPTLDNAKVSEDESTKLFFEERIGNLNTVLSFFNMWKKVKLLKQGLDIFKVRSTSEITLTPYEAEALKGAISYAIESKKSRMATETKPLDIEVFKSDIERLEKGVIHHKDFITFSSYAKTEEIENLTETQSQSFEKMKVFLDDYLFFLRSGHVKF